MKSVFFAAIVFLFALAPLGVKAEENPSKADFFEASKVYQDKDYALNDVIEFSIFDMSEVKFLNESDKDSLQKTKDSLMKLPKLFYQNLKNEILTEQVPVTLYPSDAPEHTKPLKLSIKVKTLHLKPAENPSEQSISLRIFGQIEDKKTDEDLFKFYDSGTEVFSPSGDINAAFAKISDKIMKNLALFLKSKY